MGVVKSAATGNSTKKEDFEHLPELTQFQIDSLENGFDVMVMNEGQKCWKGYEKKGTKKMFGKTYNNCVKKEEVEVVDEENMVEDPRTTWYEEEGWEDGSQLCTQG